MKRKYRKSGSVRRFEKRERELNREVSMVPTPELAEEPDELKSFHFEHCQVCGTPLCTEGGCAGTGMCGPCCTGDASTTGKY